MAERESKHRIHRENALIHELYLYKVILKGIAKFFTVFSNLLPRKEVTVCFQTTPGIFSKNLLLKSMRDKLLAAHHAGKLQVKCRKLLRFHSISKK